MNMTIKELADALEVSKTAVRKYMTENFRQKHTETDGNGVIKITPEGCKLIAESMGRSDNLFSPKPESTPKTEETNEYITVPRSLLSLLEDQIREKDTQITAKDNQIAELTETIKALSLSVQSAQALHAGTIQAQLESAHGEDWDDAAVPEDAAAPSDPKPGLFRRIFSFGRK